MKCSIRSLLKYQVRRFLWSADAHAATEYAILLALLILGSMAVIHQIGLDFSNIYTNIKDSIGASTGF